MEASAILKIDNPGDLFEDRENLRGEYATLAKQWHPDMKGGNAEVFAHITKLYELARSNGDVWFGKGKLVMGKVVAKYLKKHTFELGKMFVCKGQVIYVIDKRYAGLAKNAQDITRLFSFPNERVRWEIDKYLPHNVTILYEGRNNVAVSIRVADDMVLLKDVLSYYYNKLNGNLEDRHAAWIIGTMYNVACYLQFLNISHNSISTETYFISPKNHTGALIGGWWYAKKIGERLSVIPAFALPALTPSVRTNKLATHHLDLDLIRMVGLEMLNGRTSPKPMFDWFKRASIGNAVSEYALWEGVLTSSFGPRKFVDLNLTPEQVYEED
jgi:hypothetical protein